MKNWKYLNFAQRKIIANQLSHDAKLCEIAQLLDIVSIFDEIENTLGINDFIKAFPCIFTDRNLCFSDFLGIEFSHITGEQRTHLFFCDSFTSCQKGNVENMNKQLRKFFKKGDSVDGYFKEDIKDINMTILKTRVASLNGFTTLEAFTKVYGKHILDKLLNL